MADIVKTVGDGHALPDYATLTLWNAAEGGNDPGVGFTSIAECSGFCGAGANINGAFVRGAIIRGDVTWDGTNGALLADTERLTISTGSGIDVTDLRIFTNNQFISAMNYNADFIDMDRVVFDNTTAAVNALDINGNFPNGNIRNFVARGGADAVMAGFNQGTNLTNGLIYGATDKGVEGGGSTPMVLTNILAFNNGGNDIDSAGGFALNDVATEDGTGTYTGYTSSELVDFANGDLRTKSTSDLATLGSPFIGAFLEQSAGSSNDVSITSIMPSMTSALSVNYTLPSQSASITSTMPSMQSSVTANYTIPGNSASIVSVMPSMQSSITVTQTAPSYNSSISSVMPSMVSTVSVSNLAPGNNLSISSVMPSMTSAISISKANPQYSASITSTMPSMLSSVGLSVDSPEYNASIESIMPSMTSSLSLAVGEPVNLSLTISSTMPSMISSLRLVNGEVSEIGDITVSFVDDSISVEYTQSAITINYEE